MSIPCRTALAGVLMLLLGSLSVAALAADRIVVLEHYTNFR